MPLIVNVAAYESHVLTVSKEVSTAAIPSMTGIYSEIPFCPYKPSRKNYGGEVSQFQLG